MRKNLKIRNCLLKKKIFFALFVLGLTLLCLIQGCRLFPPSGSGIKPKVKIVEPVDGDTVGAVNVIIKVEVTAKEEILKVRFLDNDFLLGEVHSAPYELLWETSNVSSGEHILRAEATDKTGNTGRSNDIIVTVSKQGIYDWTLVDSNNGEDLNCIFAFDTIHIWSCGNSGRLLFFDGSDWQSSTISSKNLAKVFFVSQDLGWCIGENTLFAYNNGIWTSVQTMPKEEFTSISLLNDSMGWIGDSEGKIFAFTGDSLNGCIQVDTAPIADIIALSSSNIWALCGSSFFHNSGLGWGKDTVFMGEEIYAFCSPNGSSLWAGGTKLFVYNGGQWIVNPLPDSLPSNSAIMDMDFASLSEGIACGEGSGKGFVIGYNGSEWQKESVQGDIPLRGICIFSDGEGWAVGKGGKILHRKKN